MNRSTIVLLASVCFACSDVSADETKVFPSPHWASWLHISYPASFKVDPKSFQGEAKWWGKINDPKSDLSIQLSAFGYVSDLDLLLTVPGADPENYIEELVASGKSIEEKIEADAKHKNVGDYFKAHILPKGCETSKFPGYERFIQKKNDGVVVFFLSSSAYKETYGRCYQALSFTFSEGKYSEHRKVIDAIIASAKPPFEKLSESGPRE